jgi:acyl-CoA reductase-like NAD-dependent aldehyde dehydrogenase
MLYSINPATGEEIARYPLHTNEERGALLSAAAAAQARLAAQPVANRAQHLFRLADVLDERAETLARVAVREMGKPLRQARAEVQKCARACRYYAEHGPAMLGPEPAGVEGARAYVQYQPLGVVLAVMPWNFPYWQVVRFLAPALVAGNTGVLKHAETVTGCAFALADAVAAAGLDSAVLTVLLARHDAIPAVIADDRIAAVTVTGSERAGRAVAAAAGAALKPSVLELGGSDAFVVLADADLDAAVRVGVEARTQNNGQSCIAAKRFIVEDALYDAFAERFTAGMAALRVGDPMDEATDVGPLARADLREGLHRQVMQTLAQGARLRTGGHALDGPGSLYAPTVLDGVVPGHVAFEEEVFGPVAALVRARDADDAVRLANATRFGLGGAVFTADVQRGEQIAHALRCGGAFVNAMVRSDPAVPFGGVGVSGYGRELSTHGLRAFCNAKTVWVEGDAEGDTAPAVVE